MSRFIGHLSGRSPTALKVHGSLNTPVRASAGTWAALAEVVARHDPATGLDLLEVWLKPGVNAPPGTEPLLLHRWTETDACALLGFTLKSPRPRAEEDAPRDMATESALR